MLKVADVMRRDVPTVAPDTGLRQVAAALSSTGVSSAAVSEDGRLRGIVTETHLLHGERARRTGRPARRWRRAPVGTAGLAARDVMQAPPATVPVWAPLASAVTDVTEADAVAVVSSDRLVGLLTRTDVVRAVARPDAAIAREVRDAIRRLCWEDPTNVAVSVEAGRVLLSGNVESPATADALVHQAQRTLGAVEVESSGLRAKRASPERTTVFRFR
jgi:CBS domain-containing protein